MRLDVCFQNVSIGFRSSIVCALALLLPKPKPKIRFIALARVRNRQKFQFYSLFSTIDRPCTRVCSQINCFAIKSHKHYHFCNSDSQFLSIHLREVCLQAHTISIFHSHSFSFGACIFDGLSLSLSLPIIANRNKAKLIKFTYLPGDC